VVKSICSVDGCDCATVARGWCRKHYVRWHRSGDVTAPSIQDHPSGCVVDGCERPYRANGMCRAHHLRFRAHGDAFAHVPVGSTKRGLRTDDERFWSKVDATGDCWEWTGQAVQGYGSFTSRASGTRSGRIGAHRWAYQTLIGPVPEGLVLDHRCRNTRCVSPTHLDPVTQGENVRRGVRATRAPALA
jgi:hypothetical protein